LTAGAPKGLAPVGLGARDTLRLEMGYLLYGSDMTEKTSPLEAGLSWIVKMNKGDFIGRQALAKQKDAGVSKRIFAIEMAERGIPRSHYEVWDAEKKIGEVTSGTFSPSKKMGIALIRTDSGLKIGDTVFVNVREKKIPARVVKAPFVPGSVKK